MEERDDNLFIKKLQNVDFEELIKLQFCDGNKSLSGVLESVKNKPHIQLQEIRDNKAYHENIAIENVASELYRMLCQPKSTLTIICEGKTHSFKRTKKGTPLYNCQPNDRQMRYEKGILSPALPVLVELGVSTIDGKIKAGMQNKFAQVQRFTEIAALALGEKKSVKIIDCGCGKAYLSFVLYDYLVNDKKLDTHILGVDLKSDVISELIKTADKYGYKGMEFVKGNIFDVDFAGFDMMISLHACDKATDYALFNAIKNDVQSIIAVPCCQHEMNQKFNFKQYNIFNRYPLIKERISALLTDSVRASILTYFGYKTKMLEFASLSHSPKNIMLLAQKGGVSKQSRDKALAECEQLLAAVNSTNELYTLIKQGGLING